MSTYRPEFVRLATIYALIGQHGIAIPARAALSILFYTEVVHNQNFVRTTKLHFICDQLVFTDPKLHTSPVRSCSDFLDDEVVVNCFIR